MIIDLSVGGTATQELEPVKNDDRMNWLSDRICGNLKVVLTGVGCGDVMSVKGIRVCRMIYFLLRSRARVFIYMNVYFNR